MNDFCTFELSPSDSAITLEPHERQPCEIWTRVMGYHRPVASFNSGKQAEFEERKFFVDRSTS